MPAKLMVADGDTMHEIPCTDLVTIGRTEDNTIMFDDPKVSRHHAMVRTFGNDVCFLVDTGSSNGTYVNGRRVTVPQELKDGDKIEVCGNSATFVRGTPLPKSDTQSIVLAPSTLLTVGGVVERVTALVADVWGYTPLSASMDPDDLAVIMGRLFAESSRVIEENGGVVDKFAGDSVLALWVGRDSLAKHTVLSALKTVIAIQKTIAGINNDFPCLESRLRMGFGVNNGQAVLGTFGARHKREFTALGDAVNVTFRIEAATRILNCDIAIGADAYAFLDTSKTHAEPKTVTVKGKSTPISVLALSVAQVPPLLR